MSRSKSSRRWLDRHFNDPYVKRVQIDGYRSRAAYKLLEIQEKDLILRPGMRVVDLGAAPGSWSQIASNLVGTDGLVVALDILPMEPLPGVIVLQGDFREDEVLRCLRAAIGEAPLDLVLSDMAPNLTGTAVVDQTRAMYLVELALDLARTHLRPGGALVTKVFQGAGCDDYTRELRASFKQVVTRKPKSSRSESREVFLVAKGFRP
ncbi:23S rRNA (uridine(2552)-2'-O)-methyltransferase RlmE [Thermochromatium tepidum]|jgi:23S rRNA Um-2552 2'-O-methyltransferase (EC 2.1.1.-)|uniref:Ribosomal RNA large subunit methyltransferase E n=1 Tax=Thermochromatium tepidum ATCC 43061 TaxID=316276 RepID=A0A6I6DVU2_THETI|nr:23S rRNA (uridine(2552)-2'-O)-methyltransferase RlmE [Thermochromatium tepidum]QGU31611.1 23S rRNA (uridine(2552)-2'-O)-methyltransferase RlmE [Thermochromatium tepidum ATCC 43061]